MIGRKRDFKEKRTGLRYIRNLCDGGRTCQITIGLERKKLEPGRNEEERTSKRIQRGQVRGNGDDSKTLRT